MILLYQKRIYLNDFSLFTNILYKEMYAVKKNFLLACICLLFIAVFSCFLYYVCFGTNDNANENITQIETGAANNNESDNINGTESSDVNKSINTETVVNFNVDEIVSHENIKVILNNVELDAYKCRCVPKSELYMREQYDDRNNHSPYSYVYYNDIYIHAEDLIKCGFEANYDKKSNILRINKTNNTKSSNYEYYRPEPDIVNIQELGDSFYRNLSLRIFLDGTELTNTALRDFDSNKYCSPYFGFSSDATGVLISINWIERFYCVKDGTWQDEEETMYKLDLDYNYPVCTSDGVLPPVKITEPLTEYAKENFDKNFQNWINICGGETVREKITNFNSFYVITEFYQNPLRDPMRYEEIYDRKKLSDFFCSGSIKLFGESGIPELREYQADYLKVSDYLAYCKYSIDENKLVITPKSLSNKNKSNSEYDLASRSFRTSSCYSDTPMSNYYLGTSTGFKSIFSRPISCVDLKLYSGRKEIVPDDCLPSFLSIDGELYIKLNDFAKALKEEPSTVLPKISYDEWKNSLPQA